jgi:hypothetical protein
MRTVKTASGATAVQIVYSSRRGSRRIEHLGSAHDEQELEALKAAARQRLAEGQGVLDLGLEAAAGAVAGSGPLPITSSRMGHLWDALCRAYAVLGLEQAAGGDEVFRDLVLARIIEPASKLDSLRVVSEVGLEPVSYRTVTRRLPIYAMDTFRQQLAAACAKHAALGPNRWCSTTCPRSTSRPTLVTGSASPGSPRNAGWSRRSPSGCSPTRPGSR